MNDWFFENVKDCDVNEISYKLFPEQFSVANWYFNLDELVIINVNLDPILVIYVCWDLDADLLGSEAQTELFPLEEINLGNSSPFSLSSQLLLFMPPSLSSPFSLTPEACWCPSDTWGTQRQTQERDRPQCTEATLSGNLIEKIKKLIKLKRDCQLNNALDQHCLEKGHMIVLPIPPTADWNLDKVWNISFSHPKIVKVAVSDVAWNIS